MSETIREQISSFRDHYWFLSNFYMEKLQFDGIVYPSAEHAYQAQKTLEDSWRTKIANLESASRAKQLGRMVPLRPDWEEHKTDIMRNILRAKFDKHTYLATLLLQTGEAELIEGNYWGDDFWGMVNAGGNLHGKNWLGKLLMEVRSELQRSNRA